MTEGSGHPRAHRCLDGKRRPFAADGPPGPDLDLRVGGIVHAGHGVAGGGGRDAPHPEGSLARQHPIFRERGLDLGRCYPGTLNVSIRPLSLRIHSPAHRFEDVRWTPKQPAETFLFARCAIEHGDGHVAGFVYLPDPETKTVHFDDPSQIQVVAPFVPNAVYGAAIALLLASSEVALLPPEE